MSEAKDKPCHVHAGATTFTLRRVSLDEVVGGALPLGSLILVRWLDASDAKATLKEHQSDSGDWCKDWGVYLGVSGRTKRVIMVGKDVAEVHNTWGATRIPVALVEEVYLILPREDVSAMIQEIKTLGRRIRMRRHQRREDKVRVRIY